MDEGLTPSDIAAFRQVLLERREDLKAEQNAGTGWRATVELDQQSVGRLSRMDALQQQAMSEAEARRRAKDLLRIEAALNRMESGDYGWCAACGEAIAKGRLKADPMAHLCVNCAG